MKQLMIFNLPEDREELQLAQDGPALLCAAVGFRDWLRKKRKYEDVVNINIIEVEEEFWSLFEGLVE